MLQKERYGYVEDNKIIGKRCIEKMNSIFGKLCFTVKIIKGKKVIYRKLNIV